MNLLFIAYPPTHTFHHQRMLTLSLALAHIFQHKAAAAEVLPCFVGYSCILELKIQRIPFQTKYRFAVGIIYFFSLSTRAIAKCWCGNLDKGNTFSLEKFVSLVQRFWFYFLNLFLKRPLDYCPDETHPNLFSFFYLIIIDFFNKPFWASKCFLRLVFLVVISHQAIYDMGGKLYSIHFQDK